MSFASPLFLGLALAALVVLLLHTLQRQRRVVGSVLIWRQLALDSVPRRSLRLPKPNLLMLLQILAVLLIALALAQPRWQGAERPAQHHVFVLDVSASMGTRDQGGTRLAAAQAALAGELAALTLQPGDRLSVIVAGPVPRLLAVRHASTGAARALVAGLQPTDGAADWPGADALLPSLLTGPEAVRLSVLTDDATGAALGAPALAPRILGFGAAGTANAGVTARLRPDPDDPARWRLEGRVLLRGLTEAPPLSLRFRAEGGATFLDWAPPAYGPPDAEGVPFAAVLDLPGPGLLELMLPADAAPYDDRHLLRVPDAAAQVRVLYVGPGNPALLAALQASGRAEVLAATALPADVGRYDLVALDSAVVPATPAGNLLWLGAARAESEGAPRLVSTLPDNWDAEHPLSAGLDWAALPQMRSFAADPLPGARVIAAAEGVPLVQARTRPDGRELRIAIDPADPAWTGAPQFPLLVASLLDWLVPRQVAACVAGQPCALPARLLSQTVTDPSGAALPRLAASGAATLPEALVGGFLPLRAGLHQAGVQAYPVNADPRESTATVLPAAAPTAPEVPESPGWPLARWVLVAVLVVILAEGALAFANPESRAFLATRSPEGGRQRLALALRGGTLLLALAALTSAPFPQLAPAEQIVVIVPPQVLSDPVRLAALAPGCTGLLVQGAPPRVAQDLACDGPDALLPLSEGAAGSDLGVELDLALAMMAPGTAGRVILAGAAPQTGGTPQRAAEALVRAGVRLDLLPLAAPARGDAWVGDIALPAALFAGDTAPLTAIIHSDTAMTARVEIGQDDRILLARDMPLVAGANRIDTTVPDLVEGTTRLWLRVTAPGDPQPLNDTNAILRRIAAAPHVAIVTPEADRGQIMADALAVQGLRATVLRPDRAPFRISGWLDYDGVILMNVPALDLDTRQQEQLAEFAGLHGRGLMILGGENSFGPGGYFRTPLEVISPLSAQVPREAPVAAIAFVLDRSGSMQAPVEGVTRLQIAKEATLAAIGLLNAESQAAIVVFDTEPRVILPLQERRDLAAAEAALGPIDPGGGTSIAPGLAAALDELDRADAAIRHVVVMSDGLTQPGDFEGLVARATESGITVSTVSIGDGADVGRLAELARAGGGSSHQTRDFRALPGILSQEAMMLGGEAMEQGPAAAFWEDRSAPWLTGLPDMPPVDAWVRTSLKPGANQHVALTDPEGNLVPILASWRYGNGTVLALASHAIGPGTVRWQMQPHFPLIYAQVMRALLAEAAGPLSIEVRRRGDQLHLHAAALTETGQIAPDTPLTAILRQGAVASPLPLVAVRDGWAAQTAPLPPGDWIVSVAAGDLQAEVAGTLTYSANLDPGRADPALLAALSALTGGRTLAAGQGIPQPGQSLRLAPGWQPWALLALVALMLDLAVRYVPGLLTGLRRAMGLAPTRRSLA